MGNGIVEFLRKGGVFGDLAQGAVAGVDLFHQFIGVGGGGVQVVIERIVLEQFACGAFALVKTLVILSSRSTASLARE